MAKTTKKSAKSNKFHEGREVRRKEVHHQKGRRG
jgi:hypothetical protein